MNWTLSLRLCCVLTQAEPTTLTLLNWEDRGSVLFSLATMFQVRHIPPQMKVYIMINILKTACGQHTVPRIASIYESNNTKIVLPGTSLAVQWLRL